MVRSFFLVCFHRQRYSRHEENLQLRSGALALQRTADIAAARGLPFKGIVTHEKTLFWIIASPEIRRMEDLIGKTITVGRLATLQDIVAHDLVKRKGINPDQVTFIQTGSVSNSVQSLSQGSVAAALLSLPHNFVMTQKGYRELASAREFNQRSASGGIATRETKLKQDPAQLKAVIRATFEASAIRLCSDSGPLELSV